MATNEDSWIDLLMTVGKELGLEVPRPGRPWPPAPPAPARQANQHDSVPPGTRLIESSESLSREGLAEMLESLASKIRDGEVALRTGGYSVNFEIPHQVTVDLAAVSQDQPGGNEIELGIVVHWQAPTAGHGRHSP